MQSNSDKGIKGFNDDLKLLQKNFYYPPVHVSFGPPRERYGRMSVNLLDGLMQLQN